ncbi:hypothetical protein [Hypericibacter sp.]|uniref:hypothetical protein n=1 Tax=Hypericibacter sp. TaxID=2705401 RepID=UPI003D6D8794
MRNWLRVLRVGVPLLLAAVILSGCVVSPYPAYYAAPRPYYYHPYYYGYHGYYGSGWGGRGHW